VTVASKIKDLTGPGHTDRFGIGGTDLGVTVVAPDGRLVSVFGDTFEKAGVGGPGWRSPVVLFGDPATVRTGIVWTAAAGPGDYADQVLAYEHGSVIDGRTVTTVLPTDIITIGNEMYLHVMVCEGLGNVHWTELHRSTDNGETWSHAGVTWPGGHHGGLFQMLTCERGVDGYVYVFSTGFQRDKGLVLQRVPADRFAQPAAWQTWGYRDGQWAWGNPPTVALSGEFGELCLRRVEGRWLLALFDADGYRIDVLSLDSPMANLYQAQRETLVHGTAWDAENHAQGRVAQLYGGYLLPGSTLEDLHLVVSQWNTTTNWPYRAMQFHATVTD
jgi:D-arabinan endo alpha-(1,5)-arabinofuranosidase